MMRYKGPMTPNDKRIMAMFGVVFLSLAAWAFASQDVQSLFHQRTPEQIASAQQKALDHLFGSDQSFDPAAENVLTTANNKQDNVSWKTLAHAKLKMEQGKAMPEGVAYGADVQKLDGQFITITGYMFPLDAAGNQAHFLLSAYPPSCPYCVPGGPTELIEIKDSAPIKFTYDAVTLHGNFHLLQGDALKEGVFYRLTQAALN